MYCVKCGKENKDEDLYCNNCGNKLDKAMDKNLALDKENKITKRKLSSKVVAGVIALIVIGIGITIYSMNKHNVSYTNSSSTDNNKVDQSVVATDTLEKSKEDELALKEKTANEAKETFGKLLQDKVWLCKNANYANNGSNTFSILDIDQDGIPEMLLSNSSGGLANYSLSVVTYNNGNVNVQVINTSHGGFAGYLSDEKVFFIKMGSMGTSFGIGYKLEGNQCTEAYSWEDNSGTGKDLVCKINKNQVSEEEYKEFCKKFENAESNSNNFYEINSDNIKKVLGVEPIKVEQTNESIKDIDAYKVAISKGIKEAMKEQFDKNAYRYITPVNFKEGNLKWGDDKFDGLVAIKDDSSKYILLSVNDPFFNNATEYVTHRPDINVVAWAKLRNDGIYEVRGEYLYEFQVNSGKDSIISNYNSDSTKIDDSCILVYPDGTIIKTGKLNKPSYFAK